MRLPPNPELGPTAASRLRPLTVPSSLRSSAAAQRERSPDKSPEHTDLILGVRADPEPSDLVALQEPEGAISQGDANRIEGLAAMNLLELQLGMLDIFARRTPPRRSP